jgi:N-hydroxyarylamine O-acetyltransferase
VSRAIDVENYFQRIGYDGSRAPTLETLRAIHLRHPQAIAFENLDPLLKRPISLESQALQGKLVHSGRGGWCFEHNSLLADVLESLGFRVARLAARVMWNAPVGSLRPRTHMLLRIDSLDGGPYIADVGFGGLTLTGPLRLVPDVEQATPHESFRLIEAPEGFVLETLLRETWKPLYSFDLQQHMLPDYEVWNWYLEHHPASPFVNNLMVARVTDDRRFALSNNKLSVHHLGGESEQTTLASPAELRTALERTFAIRLPDDSGLDALLARFTQPTSDPL